VSLWHCLDEADNIRWKALAEKKPLTGFNLFVSDGMKEFEEIQRVLEIKASVRSSRRFVRLKIRDVYTDEWHALLLHALILSSAFRYRRE